LFNDLAQLEWAIHAVVEELGVSDCHLLKSVWAFFKVQAEHAEHAAGSLVSEIVYL